jgi:hypothetical protein
MAQYLLLYHDPKMSTASDRLAQIDQVAKQDQWSREISNAVLDGGSPTTDGKHITREGIKPLTPKERVTNYCIIEARDPEEAVELAKGAPYIYDGGSAEVYQIVADQV